MAASSRNKAVQSLCDVSGCMTQDKHKRSSGAQSTRKQEKRVKTSKDLLSLPEEPSWKHILVCSNDNGSKRAGDGDAARPPWALAERPCIGPTLESSLMSRIRDFLPMLKNANDELQAREEEGSAHELDIEVITGGEDAPHILMDVALGVAELRTPEAVDAAQRVVNGSFCPPLKAGSDGLHMSSEEEEDSSDSDTEEVDVALSLQRQKRKAPKVIEEL